MKKGFKLLSMLVIAMTCFFVGYRHTDAYSHSQFIFDKRHHFKLSETLTNGDIKVTITPYDEVHAVYDDENWNYTVNEGDYEINAQLTKISKEVYDKLKAEQDKIDAKRQASQKVEDSDINQFQQDVRDSLYWCPDQPMTKTVKLEESCDKQYYILVVDVFASGKGNSRTDWEYQTARVYEVEPTKDAGQCKCTKEGNNYYDLSGVKTDEANYKKVCGCRVEGSTYYDQNGKSVSKENYYKMCNPKCREQDGKYYGKDGEPLKDKEAFEEYYKKYCEKPDNPHTGISTPYIVSGIVAIGAIVLIIASKKKKFI